MPNINDFNETDAFRVVAYCWNIIDAKRVIDDCKRQNPDNEYVIRLQVIELKDGAKGNS